VDAMSFLEVELTGSEGSRDSPPFDKAKPQINCIILPTVPEAWVPAIGCLVWVSAVLCHARARVVHH
jgi:hypothetical protein